MLQAIDSNRFNKRNRDAFSRSRMVNAFVQTMSISFVSGHFLIEALCRWKLIIYPAAKAKYNIDFVFLNEGKKLTVVLLPITL